ncbi:MAG TPA: glycogen-binding domain-containing protein [Gemmatimonadaceae bacterium]|nr:glycogen-binding domain-containing protein [Gemmatimonadaceae bacterium]
MPAICARNLRTVMALVALIALSPIGATRVAGQLAYGLDIGGAYARFDDTSIGSGVSFSPSLVLDRGPFSVAAAGAATILAGGGLATQGLATGSYRLPLSSFLGLEVAATGFGVAVPGATRRLALGTVRFYSSGREMGGWIGGGGGGRTAPEPAVGEAEAGVWWRRGPLSLDGSLTLRAYRTLDAFTPHDTLPHFDTLASQSSPTGRAHLLRDVGIGAHYRQGPVEIDLTGAARMPSASDAGGLWGSASVAFWVTRSTALVVRGGSEPSAPLLGLPGSHFLVAGLRLAPPPLSLPQPHPKPDAAPTVGSASSSPFHVEPETGGKYLIRVTAPGARQVALMGDFSEWAELRMEPVEPDTWEIRVALSTGVHRVAIRIDDGAWLPPPGVARVPDEFGGQVGVFVVADGASR